MLRLKLIHVSKMAPGDAKKKYLWLQSVLTEVRLF